MSALAMQQARRAALGAFAAVALCAAALTACAHAAPAGEGGAAQGEAALAQRPKVAELAPFAAPVPRLHTLANGLRVYVVQKQGDGIEALQLVVKKGGAGDPQDLPGLASLAMEMLEAGSAGRTQAEMARAADAIGANIRAGSSVDGSVISASAMATQLDKLVPLFADVALRPNFDAAEWKRLLGQREAELIAARAEPRAAASRAFSRSVYGQHPYGRPSEGTVESVRAMKLDDARAFVGSFRPDEAALIAVGGADETKVLELLRLGFEGWKAPAQSAAPPATPPQAAAPPAERPRLVMVDYPGKPQTVIRVGEPAVPRKSPDVLPLRLWNIILGGSFTSRLDQNLREKHGYTYGAGSGFAFGIGPGPFAASSDVKTDVTADALRELLGEVQRAVAAPLTPQEIDKAKALLAYGLVQALEHSDSTAAAVGQLFLYDLPLDELATLVPRLQKLTPDDVQAAVKRHIDPAALTIVLSGDVKKVEAQLASSQLGLPPPQLRDVEGNPIAAASR